MNELANASKAEIAAIDSLAAQARTLRANIDLNMWQLARVFVEAKELVPHGEWQGWLRENADVSVRTAEDMMAAWKRFGGREDLPGSDRQKPSACCRCLRKQRTLSSGITMWTL